MPAFIALLRAVNVTGYGKLKMTDLRDMVAGMGLADPKTLLASGNLVFRSRSSDTTALERKLAGEARRQLGLDTTFFVRTIPEWTAMISHNPFPAEAKRQPASFQAFALSRAPDAAAVRALETASKGPERLAVAGQHLYVFYPEGIGRSRLAHSLIEGKLDARATGRNWNTVFKLLELGSRL